MAFYELSPAYGRDPKTATEAKNDFITGKDWQGDYQMQFRYCGRADFKPGDTVVLRYRKLTQVATLKVTQEIIDGKGTPIPVKTKTATKTATKA